MLNAIFEFPFLGSKSIQVRGIEKSKRSGSVLTDTTISGAKLYLSHHLLRGDQAFDEQMKKKDKILSLKHHKTNNHTTNHKDSVQQEKESLRQRLEFVHIPKTAGSAVEMAAWKQGIPWGYYQFVERSGKKRKPTPHKRASRFSAKHGVVPWHVPPCLLDNQRTKNIGDETIVPNPYKSGNKNHQHNGGDKNSRTEEKVDLFTIVRNPYDRVVSEYRYKEMMMKGKSGSPDKMNEFIAKQLQKVAAAQRKQRTVSLQNATIVSDDDAFDSCRSLDGTYYRGKSEYFLDSGHWIPQYDFVFHQSLAGRRQMIQHVLKYSNDGNKFARNFAHLMKLYGLQNVNLEPKPKTNNNLKNNITVTSISTAAPRRQQQQRQTKLRRHRTHVNRTPLESNVTAQALSPENIQAINLLYKMDFEAFGFEMRQP
ncbi:hypothetical protein ACA910_002601 [Epithemia clementina (nom. ined.)]